ncbi:MAG: isoprenyl transferase [Phycisphaerales bacterium]
MTANTIPETSNATTPTPLGAIESEVSRAAVAKMRERFPGADPVALLPGVPPERVPRHIAIIMDGNGRWANERGFPRVFGHRNGAKAVRETLRAASALGVEYLTLYSFSNENWRRPPEEIRELMSLYLEYMRGERDELVKENIRLLQIGRRDGLDPKALRALDETVEATKRCTGGTLILAVNYGSRQELVDATRDLARRVKSGEIDPEDIHEHTIENHLYTAGIPDPDLLIRTAGEMRLSNYLLWQISYAELYVTDVFWPDFNAEHLRDAIRAYASRERRFGGLSGGAP